jgi:hypothetical protein
MHLWCTDVLFTGEVFEKTDLFNGNQVSELLHRDEPRTERDEPGAHRRPRGGKEASGFCRFPAFLHLMSSFIPLPKISEPLLMVPIGKKCFIANNLHSNRVGFHRVSVVYEIKTHSESPLIVPPQFGTNARCQHQDQF